MTHRTIVGTVSVQEVDSAKKTGFRTRVKLILQCQYCGWETVYDKRHLWRVKQYPCKKCQDKGPVRRTPSGKISQTLGARDVLRYGRYSLPGHIIHGLCTTRAYKSWSDMMRRCYTSSHISYPHYGGRGIKVCSDWHNPLLFYCDMGDRPEGWSIERLDPDGDYVPENCVWTPKEEQPANRRGTLMYRFPGLSKSQIQELRQRHESDYRKAYHQKTYVPRGRSRGRPKGVCDPTFWYNAAGCPDMRQETYGPLKSAGASRNRVRRWEEYWESK